MSNRKPVVIVTGASKGIGLAIARQLLTKFNSKVVVLSRSQTPELLELASEDLLTIQCDVANEVALTEAIARAVDTFHHIDSLVFNAGILDPMCLVGDDTPLSAWKDHFDVNFFSLVTGLRAALPALRKSELGGRVIFVSSTAAVWGSVGWGPYSAGKAAMNSLCRTLAVEEPGIVSVAIHPGMVDTNMQTILRSDKASVITAKGQDIHISAHRDGKLVRPDASGHVIAALALKAHKEISGQYTTWDSEECKPFRDE